MYRKFKKKTPHTDTQASDDIQIKNDEKDMRIVKTKINGHTCVNKNLHIH